MRHDVAAINRDGAIPWGMYSPFTFSVWPSHRTMCVSPFSVTRPFTVTSCVRQYQPASIVAPRVKAVAVVPHLDAVPRRRSACAHPDEALLPRERAMADGVFHDGLRRQRRHGKILVLYVILDPDGLKARHLNVGIGFRVGQLVPEGNQVHRAQGIQVLPEVQPKAVGDVPGLLGLSIAQGADGGYGIIEEVGLDLGHHDLYALLRLQGALMLAHKLHVQPDVVQQAAADDGDGQELLDLLGARYKVVQHIGDDDRRHDENGNDQVLPANAAIFLQREIHQIGEQYGAEKLTCIGKRPALVMILRVDRKADIGKQRRGVDRRVQPHGNPPNGCGAG